MVIFLVNPCDSSPCKNGGTCADDGDSFNCTCTDKFEGPTCEEKGFQFYNFTLKSQSWKYLKSTIWLSF